jgi:hypothetical protein
MKPLNEILEAFARGVSHLVYWLSDGWTEERQKEHDEMCVDPNCILREHDKNPEENVHLLSDEE